MPRDMSLTRTSSNSSWGGCAASTVRSPGPRLARTAAAAPPTPGPAPRPHLPDPGAMPPPAHRDPGRRLRRCGRRGPQRRRHGQPQTPLGPAPGRRRPQRDPSPADLQDGGPWPPACGRRSFLPIVEDLLILWGRKSQTAPLGTHLRLQDVRCLPRPGRQCRPQHRPGSPPAPRDRAQSRQSPRSAGRCRATTGIRKRRPETS